MMQINLTGFLGGSKARLFIGELWGILASAQTAPDGIPAELVEMKKKELLKAKVEIDVIHYFTRL
jgi:serine/arginine repetitive matrix protein 1